MHADAFFAIGASHLVCQDYARAGSVAGPSGSALPYAIVADGCSSSPDSDIGARLLVAAAARHLGRGGADLEPGAIVREAVGPAEATVGRRCLDATLLVASADAGGGVRVRAFGDGVVIARRRDGRLAAWEIAFASGAPAYPSYVLDASRLARYLCEGHGERTVVAWDGGARVEQSRSTVGVAADGRPTGLAWGIDFEPGAVDVVVLATDGIGSFRAGGIAGPEAVPLGSIVEQLADFRTLAGAFLARRCRSFLRRFCSENGWRHHDDLGAAAICLAP